MKKITEYNFPEDLKTMSKDELELLAVQIREFLIDKVSKTGGHIASNLGVVELTIALHKVFDCPNDKFIFDVGHQSYVHKILTGRAKNFDTMRKFGGMSGFPKSNDSIYDAFDTGHSSNSISAASGIAAARDIAGDNYEVVAVIGDGSLTGGMAYEAMNALGYSKSKVIIILNDNGMSISKNVGGLSKYLGEIRTSSHYLGAKKFIKTKIAGASDVGTLVAQGLADFKNDVKFSLMNDSGKFFEELGLTYFGPVDGHDIEKLTQTMENAKSLNEPCIIHVITKKGKGYRNAERFPRKFHGVGPFDPETGKELKTKKGPSATDVAGTHILELAKADEKIVAVTAAMGLGTGLKDFSLELPERYFDVGIAEEHAVTFAAGLAKAGLKPCVFIYSSFLQRAYDQMMMDVAMQNLPVVFALDRAGVVGADGETHQGTFDLSYLNTVPNMTVFTPYDNESLKKCLDEAFKLNSPCAVRYPRGEFQEVNLGLECDFDSEDKKKGNIQVLACGKMVKTGEKLIELLRANGKDAVLTPVIKVKPFDTSIINDKAKRIITIEDNALQGGFGETVAAALTNKNFKVKSFGWPNKFIEHGTFDELADKYGLTAEKIFEKI